VTSVVQNKTSALLSAASSALIDFTGSQPTVGNSIIIEVPIEAGGTTFTSVSATDNASGGSNAYTLRKIKTNTSDNRTVAILDCIGIARTFTQLTVSWSGGTGGAYGKCAAQEVAGITAFDQVGEAASTGSASGTVTATCTGADTTASNFVAACISLGAGQSNVGFSDPPSTGYTTAAINQNDSANTGVASAYRVNSSAVTDSVTWAYSGGSGTGDPAIIVSYAGSGGGGGGGASQAFAAPTPPGPGVSPNRRTQFTSSPRGYVVPVTNLGGISGSAIAGAALALSSLQTTGGLAFVPQAGPGLAGPFNNSQFQPAPRSAISVPLPLVADFRAGAIGSFSATLASLQTNFAAQGGAVGSFSANLTTLPGSAGPTGYVPQPGPGIGPFTNTQFLGTPLSTNPPFGQLSGAVSGAAVTASSLSLSTSVQLALAGGGLLTGSASLVNGPQMALSAAVLTSGTSSLTTGSRMAVSAAMQAGSSIGLQTGISLSLSGTSLVSASVILGNIASLSCSAAGLTSANLALSTALQLSMGGGAVIGSSLQVSASGAVLAIQGVSLTGSSLSMSGSIQLATQAAGLTSASVALLSGLSIATSGQCLVGAQLGLSSGVSLAGGGAGLTSASLTLNTNRSVLALTGSGLLTGSVQFSTGISLAMSAASINASNLSLLTVLAPPSDFADVSWIRAPRSNPALAAGALPYGEFYQRVGERLWYGIVWTDWLANRWECNTAASAGQVIRPSIANGFQYICTTAGQTSSQEPSWPSYVGGSVLDGSAVWTAQLIDNTSLEDTLSTCTWSAADPAIALSSGQIAPGQITFVQIDTTNAVAGTDYDVTNTIDTSGGQQKIGKIRVKVQ
jgi:hypothetical protein